MLSYLLPYNKPVGWVLLLSFTVSGEEIWVWGIEGLVQGHGDRKWYNGNSDPTAKLQTHSLPLGKGGWLILTSSSCWEGQPPTQAGPVKIWQRFLKVLLGSSECKLIRLAWKSMVTLDLMTQVAETPDPLLVNIYQVASGFDHEIQPLFQSVSRVLLTHLFNVFPLSPTART